MEEFNYLKLIYKLPFNIDCVDNVNISMYTLICI